MTTQVQPENDQTILEDMNEAINSFSFDEKLPDKFVGVYLPDETWSKNRLYGITKNLFLNLWKTGALSPYFDVEHDSNDGSICCAKYIFYKIERLKNLPLDQMREEKFEADMSEVVWSESNGFDKSQLETKVPKAIFDHDYLVSGDDVKKMQDVHQAYPHASVENMGFANMPACNLPCPFVMIAGTVKGGVHLVLYSGNEDSIEGANPPPANDLKIFVSARGGQDPSGGMYDQIVAGGLQQEPGKPFNPLEILALKIREEIESINDSKGEIGIDEFIDDVFSRARYEGMLSYYQDKGPHVGLYRHCLEPGFRYVYSLKVPPNYTFKAKKDGYNIQSSLNLTAARSSIRQTLKTMKEPRCLEEKDRLGIWKLNSAHVLLFFLARNGYLENLEKGDENLKKYFHRDLPFPLPDPNYPVEVGKILSLELKPLPRNDKDYEYGP